MTPLLTTPLYYFVVCYLLVQAGYFIYQQIITSIARRRIIKERGCEPPTSIDDQSCLPYPYRLKLPKRIRAAAKEHRLEKDTQERYQEYGNTHSAKYFHLDALFTIEAENVQTILATKFKDYELTSRRKRAFHPLLGWGIFSTDGADWKHSRELIRPNFARDQVADLDTFEEHVNVMIDAIPKDGKTTVDLQELFFGLTIDTATEFLFGESTNVLLGRDTPGSRVNLDFAEAWNRSQLEVQENLRSILLYRTQNKKHTRIVHDYVGKYVQQALQYRRDFIRDPEKATTKNGRYVFMHELVKATDDPVRIRDEMLNVLLAGRDTTASLLGNIWFTLARRPDIWAKLRSEVDETLKGQRPTFSQLKDMKYLKAVMNESLRLDPVVPMNSRQAITDTVLPLGGGPSGTSPILVRKGEIVNYAVWAMHRRREYYGPDAEEFKPERWERIRPTWEYLPFNGGPRMCIGQQYALTEAGYTTVRMVQRFAKVEGRDERPWTESLTLTACNLNGTKVVLTPG